MGTLVAITPEQDRAAFIAELQRLGIRFEEFRGLPRHFRLPDVKKLPPLPGIESAEADDLPIKGATDQSFTIAADFTGGNWGLARLCRRRPPWHTPRLDYSFPLATFFRYSRTGTGVDIYMLDSGIRTTHDEFGGRATNVYEFFSSGGAGDDEGHGTATSSCAAGATRGVAKGANLLSYKCLDSANAGTNTSLINAMSEALADYGTASNPGVVNMSLGGFGSTVNSGVTDMIDAGMVVVSVAGNASSDLGSINEYPAESDADVIVCGGIGPGDIPYFKDTAGSNYGSRVDVSAAAMVVEAAYRTNDSSYRQANGTSFSAPLTAGVVACLLQGESKLTTRTQVQTVRQYLIDNATTGYLQAAQGISLPDRILYLDPEFSGSIF